MLLLVAKLIFVCFGWGLSREWGVLANHKLPNQACADTHISKIVAEEILALRNNNSIFT